MELEVGMYVRTKNGYIRKIDRIWNGTDFNVDEIYYNDNIDEYSLGCVLNEDIKGEPSYKPIDLIEKGDYVNSKRVTDKIDKYIYLEDELRVSNKQIKSIVTKEQFEAMKYEIK